MKLTKFGVIIVGILAIALLILLNRIRVLNQSEKVPAIVTNISHIAGSQLICFSYQEKTYRFVVQESNLKKKSAIVLVKNENPRNFVFYTFWTFWFPSLIALFFFSAVFCLYIKIQYANITIFELFKKNKDKKETIDIDSDES